MRTAELAVLPVPRTLKTGQGFKAHVCIQWALGYQRPAPSFVHLIRKNRKKHRTRAMLLLVSRSCKQGRGVDRPPARNCSNLRDFSEFRNRGPGMLALPLGAWPRAITLILDRRIR